MPRSNKEQIRVGIIGTGFARRVQLPTFHATPGVQVVAVCSAHRDRAEAAAQEFGIPQAFSDYRQMLQTGELDLVSIVTPPHLHLPMGLAAIEAGTHLLLEKPMALDLSEARQLYQQAESAGIVHLIDHELRFSPARRRFKELVDQGFLGQLYQVTVSLATGLRADPERPWDWWSEAAKGGGLLGAVGSHQIDQLRWWFGEIERAAGLLETFIKERPLAGMGGQTRLVEADDFCSFQLRFATGALATVTLNSVARHVQGWQRVEAYGSEGTLILDRGRLWGARSGEQELTEQTPDDPLQGQVTGLPEGEFPQAFIHLTRALVESLRQGQAPEGSASFYDGMRCQAVLDAIRRSQAEEGRWVPCGA